MSAPAHVCGGRCTLGYKARVVVSICRPGDHPTGAKNLHFLRTRKTIFSAGASEPMRIARILPACGVRSLALIFRPSIQSTLRQPCTPTEVPSFDPAPCLDSGSVVACMRICTLLFSTDYTYVSGYHGPLSMSPAFRDPDG